MNKTNNLETFEIRIDGQLQTPTLTERTVTILGHVRAATAVLASKVGQYAAEALKPVILDIHDHQHGTSLRADYFAKQHKLATTALRNQYGL